ncbi:hypothetical protein [Sphingomicrobium clamense]|uniref:Uncharacterized protein n=1 Tax=Sphingomicrobium clamense TaxID=2851013 RepID=A0ABS6V5S4_9SPHN|nr:hypothetical protein [Sphingomicrobium sp. B8]MBW0144910.1 hypothetical protein [Sphingomicrobium sp. B8]
MKQFFAVTLALGACAPALPPAEPASIAPTADERWRSLPDWSTVDRLRASADIDAMRALVSANPNSAIAQRRLLVAAFQAGDADVARDALAQMSAMELLLQPASNEQLSKLVDTAQETSREVEPLRAAVTNSVALFSIPADIRLSEAIAHDPATGRWLTGSVVDRTLHVSSDGSNWQRVPTRTLGSVMGILVDEERRTLWISCGRIEQTRSPQTGFVGLVALDLDTLEEKRRITAPREVEALGDLALAPDGAVLASSPTSGEVWRLGPGRGQLAPLIAKGHLSSPQGIVVHPSGRFAYVADWAYGIAMVDIDSRSLKRLSGPANLALDGTDTMFWHDGDLIAVQNGLAPKRIVRLSLDEDGTTVTGATLLERAVPEWGEPTTGQIVGNALVYASDPQWERYGEEGAIEGEETLRPSVVRRMVLGAQ